MKATIKIYKGNADLFFNGNFYTIDWDGLEFNDETEWCKWADEKLKVIRHADNYYYIKDRLHINTKHLIKNKKMYMIDLPHCVSGIDEYFETRLEAEETLENLTEEEKRDAQIVQVDVDENGHIF